MGAIMVIEDHADVRELVCAVLTDEGYAVIGCEDGKCALEELDSLEKRGALPALILLDVRMPVMDGPEFRRRQLAIPAFAAIPVYLISSGHDLETMQDELCTVGVIQKPVRIRQLLELAARYCPK